MLTGYRSSSGGNPPNLCRSGFRRTGYAENAKSKPFTVPELLRRETANLCRLLSQRAFKCPDSLPEQFILCFQEFILFMLKAVLFRSCCPKFPHILCFLSPSHVCCTQLAVTQPDIPVVVAFLLVCNYSSALRTPFHRLHDHSLPHFSAA